MTAATARPTLPGDLLEAMARLERSELLALLLDDLLTPAEVRSVGERWQIVKQLVAGVPQRQIRDALGVSITTVSRGAKQVRYGSGGFDHAFDVLAGAGHPDPRRSKQIAAQDAKPKTNLEPKTNRNPPPSDSTKAAT